MSHHDTPNIYSVVVVVVLFHYGLKYEYFYNDIVLKWLWVKYFQSKKFYRTDLNKINLVFFIFQQLELFSEHTFTIGIPN